MVEVQNVGLGTQKWKIILMTIEIDAKSGERIVDCRHAIYFRFSKIPVSGMKKGEQPPGMGYHTK